MPTPKLRTSLLHLLSWPSELLRKAISSWLTMSGALFFCVESYEVLTDINLTFSVTTFLALSLIFGLLHFLFNGFLIEGFLRQEVNIPNPSNDTKIVVKFGDLFAEDGWKAIGANDFFDNIVDEDLISSRSLHGIVLNTYWSNNKEDWKKQINASLPNGTGVRESRSRGNQIRYPIGTTARASATNQRRKRGRFPF